MYAWPNTAETRLVDVQNASGFSPLHYAVWVGRKEAIQVCWAVLCCGVLCMRQQPQRKLRRRHERLQCKEGDALCGQHCEYMSVRLCVCTQALASYDASLKVVNNGNDFEWIRVRQQ